MSGPTPFPIFRPTRISRAARVARLILCGSVVCWLVPAVAVSLRDGRWLLLVALAGVGSAAWVVPGWLSSHRWPAGLWLTAAVLNLLVLVPEVWLRVVDFRYQSGIRFGDPRQFSFRPIVPHRELLWTLDPRDPDVNRHGFPGSDTASKENGTYRVLFLGDSCTMQGYPRIVERILDGEHRDEGVDFESVNMAVAGYSSHQGRTAARLYGAATDPDLVVVYFGWNDHWRAYGSRDSLRRLEPRALGAESALSATLRRSRLGQGVLWLADGVRGRRLEPTGELRVPPGEFRRNLAALRDDLFAGVPVAFVTAPSSHGSLGVPPYLIRRGFAGSAEEVAALHTRYADIVREVAAAPGGHLFDLAEEISWLPEDVLDEIFRRDGIHFTAAGLVVVAHSIARRIDSLRSTARQPGARQPGTLPP